MEIAEAKMRSNKNIVCSSVNCNEGFNKPMCQSVDVRSYPIVVAWYKGNWLHMPTRRGPAEDIKTFCAEACTSLMA